MIHLDIGGSSFARTVACSGWFEACKNLPKNPPGPAAVQGSMHHMVQEQCQIHDVQPETLIGLVYKEGWSRLEFTENDLELSNICYTATNKLLDKYDIDEILIEPFVQLIEGVAGGSIDILGISADGETAIFIDYKFGRVKVDVKKNAQLLFYLICARADPTTAALLKKVKKFHLIVVQPRVTGVTFQWSCDNVYAIQFEREARKAIDKALADDPPRTAGPHCQYCPASPYCPERRFKINDALLLTATHKDELQTGADMLSEVEAWVNAMKAELFTQCTRGVDIEGWKIVEKQGKRVWLDETKAQKALLKIDGIKKADITTTSLLTAPQTENVLKKKKIKFDLDDLIEKKSSGTTLAHESDDRDAVKSAAPENLKNLKAMKT